MQRTLGQVIDIVNSFSGPADPRQCISMAVELNHLKVSPLGEANGNYEKACSYQLSTGSADTISEPTSCCFFVTRWVATELEIASTC